MFLEVQVGYVTRRNYRRGGGRAVYSLAWFPGQICTLQHQTGFQIVGRSYDLWKLATVRQVA